MDDEFERLLKPAEVATILGVSRTQVYRMMAATNTSEFAIPAVRFGNTVRVRRSDLEKFIASHTTKNGKTRTR